MDPLKSSSPVAPTDPVAKNRGQAAAASPSSPAKVVAESAPARDSVTLSQAARLLAAGGAAPEASAARLAALKKSIAQGTYVVDQKLIAHSLIRDSLDLLAVTPPSGD